jgi:hypothetical protein
MNYIPSFLKGHSLSEILFLGGLTMLALVAGLLLF